MFITAAGLVSKRNIHIDPNLVMLKNGKCFLIQIKESLISLKGDCIIDQEACLDCVKQ